MNSTPSLVVRLALASVCLGGIALHLPAQSGRTMSMPVAPIVGQAAQFRMSHPLAAAGRFNLFFASLPTSTALSLPIPGFTTIGSVRIDPSALLLNHFTVLDATGATNWTLPIPAVPAAAGFSFDVQTVDFDLMAANAAWADNDINAVVAPMVRRLVINEIDYDQPLIDDASFIEILNTGNVPFPLAAIRLILVNGLGSAQYASYDLSQVTASLAPGQYLVVGNASIGLMLPPGLPFLSVVGDFIQNGAPDGVALFDSTNGQLLDALSYEGSITNAGFTGFPGTWSLVEGTAFPGADHGNGPASLGRFPNGIDTNNAIADWVLSALPSPGFPNHP